MFSSQLASRTRQLSVAWCWTLYTKCQRNRSTALTLRRQQRPRRQSRNPSCSQVLASRNRCSSERCHRRCFQQKTTRRNRHHLPQQTQREASLELEGNLFVLFALFFFTKTMFANLSTIFLIPPYRIPICLSNIRHIIVMILPLSFFIFLLLSTIFAYLVFVAFLWQSMLSN